MSKFSEGVQASLSWIYTNKPEPPHKAVEAGPGVFVIRRRHERDLIPGKLIPAKGKFIVSCDNKEWEYTDGEVLCNTSILDTPRPYAWQHAENGEIPKRALVGGRASTGDALYVARCQINNEWVCGKIHEGHEFGHFPYAGEEKHITEYEVLVYKKE